MSVEGAPLCKYRRRYQSPPCTVRNPLRELSSKHKDYHIVSGKIVSVSDQKNPINEARGKKNPFWELRVAVIGRD